MAYKSIERLKRRNRRLVESRLQSQDNRDMIDAIREMLGLDPLFYDSKSHQNGYRPGEMPTHEG